jgi:hypothetical protein
MVSGWLILHHDYLLPSPKEESTSVKLWRASQNTSRFQTSEEPCVGLTPTGISNGTGPSPARA